MNATGKKQLVVIAGPAGSGKDSVAKALLARCPNLTQMVTATTRAMRPGEENGVNYHFLTNEQFKKEIESGNILEYYHRPDTDTYYGTYKPDIESRIASGKVVLAIVQIVGARFFKEHYNAATIFLMPENIQSLEHRIRARAPMSDIEWAERARITQEEIKHNAQWYDHRVVNADGKLEQAVGEVVAILQKEGYTLE